jgi:hypothetical protein
VAFTSKPPFFSTADQNGASLPFKCPSENLWKKAKTFSTKPAQALFTKVKPF